jgi:hypothetical protein
MGNKCDMDDKRVIPTERGEEVSLKMKLIINEIRTSFHKLEFLQIFLYNVEFVLGLI